MSKPKLPSMLAALRLLSVVLVLGLALVGLASPVQATVNNQSWHYETPVLFAISQYYLPYDQQESISVSATYVVDSFWMMDSSGNMHISFTQAYKNVSAVGLISGKKYPFIFQDTSAVMAGLAGVSNTSHKLMLVGPRGNVLIVQWLDHFTFNADGSLASEVHEYTSECR